MPESLTTETMASRRSVLATMALAAAGASAGPSASVEAASAEGTSHEASMQPEFYELRAYHLRRGTMSARLDAYLQSALIPAVKRAGCGPVGAFNVTIGVQSPTVHVLICHPTLAAFAELPSKLAADAQYAADGKAYLESPATDPGYAALDVRLMRAFPGFPKVEVPKDKTSPRIVELRTYRSHGALAGAKKIEMFDTAGEIAIFRRVGLTPVFFAQDLTGQGLPSITYMLTYPDLAARDKAWTAFRSEPEWKKLSSTPGYTDAEIVVGIDNQILTPTPYSEI